MGGYRAAAVSGGYRVAAVRTGTFANNAWRTGFYPGYRPWRQFPVAAAAVVGAGLAYGAHPYGYYDDHYNAGYYGNAYYRLYDSEGNYVYNAGGYYGDGGCTIIQRRRNSRRRCRRSCPRYRRAGSTRCRSSPRCNSRRRNSRKDVRRRHDDRLPGIAATGGSPDRSRAPGVVGEGPPPR